MMLGRLRGFSVWAGLGAIAYGLACTWLAWRQSHLLYFPDAELDETPALLNLLHETVEIPVGQGNAAGNLYGWWLPIQDSEQVLLYFHGNGGNISSNLSHAQRFNRMGFSVLLMDYRGYGQSTGPFPSEARFYEDAAAMWQYLIETRGIVPEQIVLYGHSLGGAIAIQLASQYPGARALVAQGSFTSMRDMARLTWYENLFPIDWLLTQRFESIDRVPQLTLPILFIHGDSDTTIPAAMSQSLYQATSANKELWIVADADHNNVAGIAGDEYLRRIQAFLDEHNAISSAVSASLD
ncbi:MAG: alpha/beta fold hydrolase [Cyanobacteria bacterium P01_A01_bin.123]